MPNPMPKSLHGYLSKIKKETRKLQLSSSKSFSSSKKWVLAGWKPPKKISFSFKHRRRPSKTRFNDDQDPPGGHAATLSDIDRFLEENFKSLCIRDDEGEEEEDDDKWKGKRDQSSSDDYSHRFEMTWGRFDSPKLPDVVTRRTERLSPPPGSSPEGRAGMYTTSEEGQSSRSNTSSLVLPQNCIAVLRYSADPQEDFKRSMVEMMESRIGESEVDWDLMEELLFGYLNINNKKSHKFILSAFVDLIISLRGEDKSITRKGLVRSLSTRAARERLRKRMASSDSFRN